MHRPTRRSPKEPTFQAQEHDDDYIVVGKANY